MDGSAMRNKALTANIAHAQSPSYRRRDVDFISELRAAVESGKTGEVARWKPGVAIDRRSEPIRLESEFAALAENNLLYETSVEVLSRRYARLKSAIFGR